jgi:hypothetical protein
MLLKMPLKSVQVLFLKRREVVQTLAGKSLSDLATWDWEKVQTALRGSTPL